MIGRIVRAMANCMASRQTSMAPQNRQLRLAKAVGLRQYRL